MPEKIGIGNIQRDYEAEYEKVMKQNGILRDQLNLSEQKLEKCGYQYVRSLELILFQIADLAKEAQSILEDCGGAPYGSIDMKAAINMIEDLATSKDDYYKSLFKFIGSSDKSCLDRYRQHLKERLCSELDMSKNEFEKTFKEDATNSSDYIATTTNQERVDIALNGKESSSAEAFVKDILKKVQESKGVISSHVVKISADEISENTKC